MVKVGKKIVKFRVPILILSIILLPRRIYKIGYGPPCSSSSLRRYTAKPMCR